jgi:nucleoside-diphosphate kinase
LISLLEDHDSMALERTLSIVKPDGVKKNVIGEVYRRFEQAGLRIIAARMTQLTQAQAEGFYAVHSARPFFKDLVRYMSSGPVIIQVLEGDNAVLRNRELMGATDPKKADKGTIRADLAASIEENVVHGSDSVDNAKTEIAYFFAASDLLPRSA